MSRYAVIPLFCRLLFDSCTGWSVGSLISNSLSSSNIYPENATANGHDFQMFSFEETTSCKACQMLLRFVSGRSWPPSFLGLSSLERSPAWEEGSSTVTHYSSSTPLPSSLSLLLLPSLFLPLAPLPPSVAHARLGCSICFLLVLELQVYITKFGLCFLSKDKYW